MSIVTKTGDKGDTGLFGGKRVSKGSARIHAQGSIDELNAFLGLTYANPALSDFLRKQLHHVQQMLFRLGADIATPIAQNAAHVPRIEDRHIQVLEKWITELEAEAPLPQYFILPGGTALAAELHLARTVCRRAERWIVALKEEEEIGAASLMFVNRLSDYLFLAALAANREAGTLEERVDYGEGLDEQKANL